MTLPQKVIEVEATPSVSQSWYVVVPYYFLGLLSMHRSRRLPPPITIKPTPKTLGRKNLARTCAWREEKKLLAGRKTQLTTSTYVFFSRELITHISTNSDAKASPVASTRMSQGEVLEVDVRA